jgi:sulfite exporter TauE/SafE
MMAIGMELTAPALFVAGATTSLHCALMCGAINAAQVRSQGPVRLHETLALVHGARVLGYALLGAIAGALGGRLALWLPATFAGQGLQLLASLALVVAGIQQLRWRRHPMQRAWSKADRSGQAWRGCGHVAVATGRWERFPRLRLFSQGLLWALMPCGILYTALLLAALTASPVAGFVLLGAFGLGTVPLMGVSGGLFGLATRPQDTRALPRFAAGVSILLGLGGAALTALAGDGLIDLLCRTGT